MVLQLFFLVVLCVATVIPSGFLANGGNETQVSDVYMYVLLFGIYIICAFILACSQAVITHIVYVRAHGGDATLRDGFSEMSKHIPALFVWACLTSTIGILMRALFERSELLGKIVALVIGATWSVLTYFVVSSIVIDKKSAFAAISHSGTVFKRTWGEAFVTNVTIGLAFFLVFIALILILTGVLLLFDAQTVVVITSGVIFFGALIVSVIVMSVLDGIIRTLLYIYAHERAVPQNFNQQLLEQILVRRTGASIPPTQGSSVV